VGQVIDQIADDEAGEHGRQPGARIQHHHEQKIEQPVEDERQRHTDNGGHDQARLALWLRVMHAVEQKEDALHLRRRWLEVEHVPVHQVFRQRPDQDAEDECDGDICPRRARNVLHYR
jgi:hypothetical protein